MTTPTGQRGDWLRTLAFVLMAIGGALLLAAIIHDMTEAMRIVLKAR